MDFIKESGAVVEGHFVYKAGWAHGNLYINKEQFWKMGARKLVRLIEMVGSKALNLGLDFSDVERVGIIGPAYGAIPFSLPLAAYLEESVPEVIFFPARTELVENKKGRKIHIIPDKLLMDYQNGVFIIHEDIINNGTTMKEVSGLFKEKANARILAATCFVDRVGHTAELLEVEQYYPFLVSRMEQHDIREAPCPLCQAGVPINIDLGKGKEWVSVFGQPIYDEEIDFSDFWL